MSSGSKNIKICEKLFWVMPCFTLYDFVCIFVIVGIGFNMRRVNKDGACVRESRFHRLTKNVFKYFFKVSGGLRPLLIIIQKRLAFFL